MTHLRQWWRELDVGRRSVIPDNRAERCSIRRHNAEKFLAQITLARRPQSGRQSMTTIMIHD
jgi:hypothetical protein